MNCLLSICIPTFNRKEVLKELISSIIVSENYDFKIEITDNASTDGTIEMLESLNDPRIVIHQNKKNIGGIKNMIRSIYNCTSKYAFYLNDKELIDISKIDKLLNFLKDEYSFVFVPGGSLENKNIDFQIYNKGFESLINNKYTHHPSGMIFNCELLNTYTNAVNFETWEGIYKYSILACELMKYEKTALFKCYIWNGRPADFKLLHKSKSDERMQENIDNLYYHYKSITKNMTLTMEYIVESYNSYLDVEQKMLVEKKIFNYFFDLLFWYKVRMASYIECVHNGYVPKFVSTYEMLKVSSYYTDNVKKTINECRLPNKLLTYWNVTTIKRFFILIFNSLKYDIYILKNRTMRQR